jgi:hypothetical protein
MFRTVVFTAAGREREEFEARLIERGIALPLQSRAAWARALGVASWFVGVEDDAGPVWGGGLTVGLSRALPGQWILRAQRFGRQASPPVLDAALAALREACRWRVLRVDVDAYSPDGDTVVGEALERQGYERQPSRRTYHQTVFVDLTPPEEAIFRSFSSSARRDIRVIDRHPLEVRPVLDRALVPRLHALLQETMARTGGDLHPEPWGQWLEFVGERPDLACLQGIFRSDIRGPDALLGFVLGYRHGDIAEYGIAASTRDPSLRAPILYAPTWELMRWAKAHGVQRFDFGGISMRGPGDPRAGIDKFKRYFQPEVTHVGSEYSFTPSRLRGAAAAAIHLGARLAGRDRRPRRRYQARPDRG